MYQLSLRTGLVIEICLKVLVDVLIYLYCQCILLITWNTFMLKIINYNKL